MKKINALYMKLFLSLFLCISHSNFAFAQLQSQGQQTAKSFYLWLYGFGVPVAICVLLFILARIKMGKADWGEFWYGLIAVCVAGAVPVFIPALWELAKSGFAGA